MTSTMDCIFCQIGSKESPCYKIWEDENYIAFLGIFPNTKGMSIVIPKEHYGSYVFEQDQEVVDGLMRAARKVAQAIDATFEDVGRTGLVFEGFGVNHLHAKLFPLHGTQSDEWKQHASKINTYFEQYQGYISSNDSERADDAHLAQLAQQIAQNIE